MDKFWGGSILGLQKHRDGCRDINNHVGILNMDEQFDPETFTGVLEVEFVDGDTEVYEFKIDSSTIAQAKRIETRFGRDTASRYLAYWIEEEMQRLRDQAEGDADPISR